MITPPDVIKQSPILLYILFPLFGFISLSGCDGMNGCAGEGDPFPNKDKIQSAIQLRVTETGFTTIGQTLTPIIKEALPPELTSCLPGDSGSASFIEWRYCNLETCTNGETGCDINISVGDVILNGIEPNVVRASVILDQLALRFDVGADPIVDCDIAIDGPDVPINLDITLLTPDPQRNLSIVVGDASYELSDLTIRLEGNDGVLSPLCEILDGAFNLPFIRDLVLDLLSGLVDNVLIIGLQGAINEFVCLPCEGDEDPLCISQGGSCILGSCIKEDLTCVNRPLGLEDQTDLGELLSSVSPNLEAPLNYFINPGSYIEIKEGGLSLGVIGGTGAEPNRCVPPVIPPNIEEPPRATVIEANVTPDGQAFDFGLAISQTMIDQALWSIYTSGAMCLGITSETVAQLNSSTLQILLPNLGSLTRGAAPVAITLAPQQPPQAVIGENRLGAPDSNGERALEDPLLTIDWPDLWLDFHVFMEDRWTRIFSLKVHLILPLGISFDPNGGIIPLLGDLNAALTDIEVANDQILIDDTSRITTLLPALTGPLIGTALSGLSDPIALPDILGFALAPQEGSLRGISEGEEDYIALYADLVQVISPDAMNDDMIEEGNEMMEEGNKAKAHLRFDQQQRSFHHQLRKQLQRSHKKQLRQFESEGIEHTLTGVIPHVRLQPVQTQAKLIESHTPPMENWFNEQDMPSITVKLSTLNRYEGSENQPQIQYEYSWRIDDQVWRPFTTADHLIIKDPMFMMPGAHQVEIRSRVKGDLFSLDPSPVELSVTLYEVPTTEELDHPQTRGLIGRVDPSTIDEASEDTGCACDTKSSREHSPWSWLLIIMVFICSRPWYLTLALSQTQSEGQSSVSGRILSKRLRSLFHLSLVFSLSFAFFACDDEAKPRRDPTECNPDQCGDNQVCFEGACSTLICLEDRNCSDLNCEGEEIAVCGSEGQCECPSAPLCPDGCGENEYCCYQTNSCERPPQPCADIGESLNCPAGFEPGAVMRGIINPQSCELEEELCECIESTPLEINSIGRHSDLAWDSTRGIAWVSAYAEDFGDLVVGRVSEEDQITWYWVDGIPDNAPVVAAPSGPRAGITEPGQDVGQYTSLIVGEDGAVHVAYYAVDERRLKYALGRTDAEGTLVWTVISLDAGTPEEVDISNRRDEEGAGRWTDIILDSLNRPVIIYRAQRINDSEQDELSTSTRVIRASEALPSSSAVWGSPITLHEVTPPESLMSLGYPEGTGLFNTITLTPTGIAAAWYDRSGGNLLNSLTTDGTFAEAEVIAGWGHDTRRGDFGANVNIAIDGTGALHYCFQDGATDSLRYLSPSLERDEWVDDGIRVGVNERERSLHVVGEDCQLSFDERDRVMISYQDATGHELLLARRDASGSWLRVTVRGSSQEGNQASYGFYARSVSLGEQVLLSHYVYESQRSPSRQYMEVLKVPSP